MSRIKVAAFDIDGVLKDGKVRVDSSGAERKNLCYADLDYMHKLNVKYLRKINRRRYICGL